MNIDRHRMSYYWNLFPFEDCCRWLSYGNGYILSLREIALRVSDSNFLRHRSFHNARDFKLNTLQACPQRIDIGAVYNISPPEAISETTRKSFHFTMTQKEMTFDIDITDYDEVRTCCKGSEICKKCWKYMAFACKILDAALREDFGFKHILWTYSGGRGIHCWVCDEKARKLRVKERGAIASYLQVVKAGAFNMKKVHLNDNVHPCVKRALKIIEPHFVEVCIEEQNFLGTDERIDQIIELISSPCASYEEKENLKKEILRLETSKERWEFLKGFLKITNRWKNNLLIEELILQFIYPRMDIGVTTFMSHLLKCPFSPHNKTKKICIPFDPSKVDDFDPTTSPDFSSLFQEFELENSGAKNDTKNLEKFRASLLVFKQFVDNLEKFKFPS